MFFSVSDDDARLGISNSISLIFDTAALSAEEYYSDHGIDQLRTLCANKGISTSGKKQELVARLSELGTLEQKKLLLRQIPRSNSIRICDALFAALTRSSSEETQLSLLETMWAIVCLNNSDGAAAMFQVNGICHAFTTILNASLQSDKVVRIVGKILDELLVHVNSVSTTYCETFFECTSHLGEALVTARGHTKEDSTKEQLSVAICNLSVAAQRFHGCQTVVEINFCENCSVTEMQAAFKLVLLAFRIRDETVKKVIRAVVAKFVKGWSGFDPGLALRRWRQSKQKKDEEVPIVSEKQVLSLVTALQKSKANVEMCSDISLAIAIIANVPQCMDRLINCAWELECESENSEAQKIGSIDIFEGIWIGIVSASNRKEANICSGLCSRIASMLYLRRSNFKACRPMPDYDKDNHASESFLESFMTVCSGTDSGVCNSLTRALIDAVRTSDISEAHKNVARMISSMNSQEEIVSSLQAATSGEEKFRMATFMVHCNMTKLKSSPASKHVIAELISVLNHKHDWNDIAIQKLIQSLDGSDELFEHLLASVQSASSAAEISRLARCLAHFDLKQFDWESDFKSFRKRGIDALTIVLQSISIKFPMPAQAECIASSTSSTSVQAICRVSDALYNFIGKSGCGSHYDVSEPLSALADSLASFGSNSNSHDVVSVICKIGCCMTAIQKSSPACQQVIDALIDTLKHHDTRDFCVAVIVDAIHTLDGCNRLIIALSSAGCDNERARIASAIVTITQRRLKDSESSELSPSSNKRQKIGGAFST